MVGICGWTVELRSVCAVSALRCWGAFIFRGFVSSVLIVVLVSVWLVLFFLCPFNCVSFISGPDLVLV